jgi:hypothetical protein
VSRYTPWRRRGESKCSSYSFLNSALDGGEWSASRPGRALPPVPIVQEAGWASEPVWTQGLEEKSFAPVEDRTPIVQPVVRHYTDWATAAPLQVQYLNIFRGGTIETRPRTIIRDSRKYSLKWQRPQFPQAQTYVCRQGNDYRLGRPAMPPTRAILALVWSCRPILGTLYIQTTELHEKDITRFLTQCDAELNTFVWPGQIEPW